jgi:transposase
MRAHGHTFAYIAQRLNVSYTAVANWNLGKQRGRAPRTFADPPTGPLAPPQLGRAPRLTDEQLRALVTDVPDGRRMTGEAFRDAIRETYGVSYSLSHACGLLRYLRGVGETRFDARNGKARGAHA